MFEDPISLGLSFGAEVIPIYQHHPNANMAAICQGTESDTTTGSGRSSSRSDMCCMEQVRAVDWAKTLESSPPLKPLYHEPEKIHLLLDSVVPVGAFEPCGVGRESDDHGGSTGVF
jgi:hypothetical protein